MPKEVEILILHALERADVLQAASSAEAALVQPSSSLLPKTVVEALSSLAHDKSIESFDRLLVTMVDCRLIEDWNLYVTIVRYLYEKRMLPLQQAAGLLAAIPYVARKCLSAEMERAVEVAELVNLDFKEGFMKVNDDDLFLNAMNDVELPALARLKK